MTPVTLADPEYIKAITSLALIAAGVLLSLRQLLWGPR
jgi:hypothetical protein